VSNEHYKHGIEPIEVIRSYGWFPDFAAGNILKYVARYRYKNGVDDLRKARQYLDWLIEHEESDA